MPNRADIAAAFDLKSPSVVEEIDQVIFDLIELRKVAVRLYGERPSTLPLLTSTSAAAIDAAASQHHEGLTLGELIAAYKADKDSGYQKLRHTTRGNYDSLMRRIDRDFGTLRITELDARRVKSIHEGWMAGGHKASAHSQITMLRLLSTFGATWLKNPECRELKMTLSGMEFEMPDTRSERITPDQVRAIRAKARQMAVPSIALAQSIQSELGLRQKDVIGEWAPMSEPGMPSDVIDGSSKWLIGIRWNQIDENLVLHHTPSNQHKPVAFDLKRLPMVVEDLQATYCKASEPLTRAALPVTGPIIIYEKTGRPYLTHQFRRVWRAVATAAGLPKTVMNMDSRVGTFGDSADVGAQVGGR